MAKNAQNDDSDLHNETTMTVDEVINIIVKMAIDISEKDLMIFFVQETWNDSSTKWEVVGETIFTDVGWDYITDITDIFEMEYDYDGLTVIHNEVIGRF